MISRHDFNDEEYAAPDLRLIPDSAVVSLGLRVRPGGAGEDGWLTQGPGGVFLDCECRVEDGPHALCTLSHLFALSPPDGAGADESAACAASRRMLRAVLESARGIDPADTGATARAARCVLSFAEFDGLVFRARIGLEKDRRGRPVRNTIARVITPDMREYEQAETLLPSWARER